jgi:hypothetical protein
MEITLEPLNREFESLVYKENAGELNVIAEVIEVLGDSIV